MIYLKSADKSNIAGLEYYFNNIFGRGKTDTYTTWIAECGGEVLFLNSRYIVKFNDNKDALVFKLLCRNCVEINAEELRVHNDFNRCKGRA